MPVWRATVSSSPIARRAIPEPQPAHIPAADNRQECQREQHLIDRHVGHIGKNVSRRRPVYLYFPPVDHLVHQLGEAEREHDEVHPAQAQRGEAHDQGHDEPDDGRRHQRDGHGHVDVQDRQGVDADAEEGCGGERDIACRAGEECPGCRQGDVGVEQQQQGQHVAGGNKGQQCQCEHRQGAERHGGPVFRGELKHG